MVSTFVHITDDEVKGTNEVVINVTDSGALQIQPFNDSAECIEIDIPALGRSLNALGITAAALFQEVME